MSADRGTRRVLERADELAALHRGARAGSRGRWLTPALAAAHGPGARVDAGGAGSRRARTRSATSPAAAARRALIIGSHLDSVADAGRYDGILGVLVGLEVAEALPTSPLEVVAFADEDGLRFQSHAPRQPRVRRR